MDSRGWTTQETRRLISIWAEEAVQRRLGGSYRNRAIFEDISREMEENGHNRSWQQCQRKIKQLKNAFRKAKDANNKAGRDRSSCPFYEQLDRVLGGPPGEGDVSDSELDCIKEDPVLNCTTETIVAGELTGPTDASGDDGAGADASTSSQSSSMPSSSKRPSAFSCGQSRWKKSKFETTLEAFSKALCNTKEVLLQMQQAQHAHEEKLFGMMMQSIASLASTIASTQCPPGHVPSYPWHQPMPPPASPSQSVPPIQPPHNSTKFSPPP